MKQLGNLPHLDDKRLGQLSAKPDRSLSALRFEEVLHDAPAILADSLDRWLIYGYVYEGSITMIAQAYEDGAVFGPILVLSWAQLNRTRSFDAVAQLLAEKPQRSRVEETRSSSALPYIEQLSALMYTALGRPGSGHGRVSYDSGEAVPT